jgi:hypothetical protein
VCSFQTKWWKATLKIVQPPAKHKETNNREGNYTLCKQSAVVKNKKIIKFCEAWGVGDKQVEEYGRMAVFSTGVARWWPAVACSGR